MGHKETKTVVVSEETIKELKFTKKNFDGLRDLFVSVIEENKAVSEQIEKGFQEKEELVKAFKVYRTELEKLNLIVNLKEKKIELLNKKIEYLRFKTKVDSVINKSENEKK